MRVYLYLSLMLLSSLASSEQYGEAISLTTEPLSLPQALATVEQNGSAKNVLVKAQVGAVCQQKGCWLSLEDDTGEMRVTFKDYGFFVPPTLKGKSVLVQGDLEVVRMSLKETRHYVADAGGDPDTVTEAQAEYRMVARGVKVKD